MLSAHPGSLDALATAVNKHKKLISGCFCVFTRWDDAREAIARDLISQGIPTEAFVLTDTPPDTAPSWVHFLDPNNVAEALAA